MTGKIHVIMPTETIASKKDATKIFMKRTLVLDCTRFDTYTGERGYDNFPSFEFSGDKCSELDNYKVGQIVSVSFDLQGNKFVDSNGKDRWFTSIRGYKVEAKTTNQQQPLQQPQAAPAQMQTVVQDLQKHGFINNPPLPSQGISNDPLPF